MPDCLAYRLVCFVAFATVCVSPALAQSPDSLQVNNLLFDAARKGCVDALELLAKAGASPAARDRMGNTALAIAAKAGRLPFVKALIEGDKAIVADELDRANVEGSTPLIQAALSEGKGGTEDRGIDGITRFYGFTRLFPRDAGSLYVTVAGSDTNGIADGTTARLDVDLNNNGSFNDAGEQNYSTGTSSGGSI